MSNAQEDRNQHAGETDGSVGQDATSNNQENSNDWESQAKYFQSEKDKLFEENKKLKGYEEVGKFLESRPDIVQDIDKKMQSEGQPAKQPALKRPDNFDPWEAYNDPSSESYRYRMAELDNTVNHAVDNAVAGIKSEAGEVKLRNQLTEKGLNSEQINSFMDFAQKHPADYGIDNVIKMWQAVNSSGEQQSNDFAKIKENQATPSPSGVLTSEQPPQQNEMDEVWKDVLAAGSRAKVL